MQRTPESLLDSELLETIASTIDQNVACDPGHVVVTDASTVYLAVGDANGMMVSYIQSNYMGFGSGIVIPETGIAMQNRGAGFVLEPGHPNAVSGGRRPYHTIIPGFITRNDAPEAAFGVMGGHMQPQGHLQVLSHLVDGGRNPQAALDAPRWRIDQGRRVHLEPGFSAATLDGLRDRGHEILNAQERSVAFGGGQVVSELKPITSPAVTRVAMAWQWDVDRPLPCWVCCSTQESMKPDTDRCLDHCASADRSSPSKTSTRPMVPRTCGPDSIMPSAEAAVTTANASPLMTPRNSKVRNTARSTRCTTLSGASWHFLAQPEQSLDWFETLTDEDVLTELGASMPSHDWYTGTTELPLGEDRGLLRIATSRLRRSMSDAFGVICKSLACEIIDADAFNRQVDRTGNKASVNFAAVLRHIERLRNDHPEDDLHVVWWTDRVDEQHIVGICNKRGQKTRSRYLMKHLPSAGISCTLRIAPRAILHSMQAGDSRHLPIALASMTAKYARELLMVRMNRWFVAAKPDLQPTAGYVQDARRYLQDIQPIIESQSIERSNLIRTC